MKNILVIKLGTAAITLPDGLLNGVLLRNIAGQLATLHQNYRLILVSSGAVGSGKPFIEKYKGTINQKKAAAAIGNPLLMATYAKYLGKYNLLTAQCLLERNHFNQRERFVQLKATITELWKNNVIPIANDNDVVNDRELRFSDNDELATLLAVAFGAEKLLIGSSVEGLLNNEGKLIREVAAINAEVMAWVKPEKSAQGLGGMASKLSHTRQATQMGVHTVIFNARQKNNIIEALAGNTGTQFKPQKSSLNARQKWLMSGKPHATIIIDEGAVKALQLRKSLLAVGVVLAEGQFVKGELIEIAGPDGNLVAYARTRIDSGELTTGSGSQVVVHANDLSLL
ncbi:MAG: glutamate 5-kinase [Chitinophagaceae bacterium]|nr:glutamate 5-kinase [Chitinophagaceae bacterium]